MGVCYLCEKKDKEVSELYLQEWGMPQTSSLKKDYNEQQRHILVQEYSQKQCDVQTDLKFQRIIGEEHAEGLPIYIEAAL